MDGALITTIVSSSVVVGGAIAGGFWRVIVKIGDQNKSIGRLEGKMDGFNTRMYSYEKQLEGFDKRVDRLDRRFNGLLDNIVKENKE